MPEIVREVSREIDIDHDIFIVTGRYRGILWELCVEPNVKVALH